MDIPLTFSSAELTGAQNTILSQNILENRVNPWRLVAPRRPTGCTHWPTSARFCVYLLRISLIIASFDRDISLIDSCFLKTLLGGLSSRRIPLYTFSSI